MTFPQFLKSAATADDPAVYWDFSRHPRLGVAQWEGVAAQAAELAPTSASSKDWDHADGKARAKIIRRRLQGPQVRGCAEAFEAAHGGSINWQRLRGGNALRTFDNLVEGFKLWRPAVFDTPRAIALRLVNFDATEIPEQDNGNGLALPRDNA